MIYHRLLRLRHYRPRPLMTAILFEGSIAVPALLAFAEVLQWWSVLAVPVAVALLVKFNDIVAGLPYRSTRGGATARGVARVPPNPDPR